MIKPLAIDITHLPAFPAGLEQVPVITLAPSLDIPIVDLLLRFAHIPFTGKAYEPIAVIVSTDWLNSPDLVTASGSQTGSSLFEMELEIRLFDGPLAANDPSIALIKIELGSLEPGEYQFLLNKKEIRFTDRQQPELGITSAMNEWSMSFNCV